MGHTQGSMQIRPLWGGVSSLQSVWRSWILAPERRALDAPSAGAPHRAMLCGLHVPGPGQMAQVTLLVRSY